MTKHNLGIGLASLAALAAGLMLAQTGFPPHQSGEAALEWEMFSENVSGNDYGTSFLYNKRTGRVYRHSYNCGESIPKFANGCLTPIPARAGADGWDNNNENPDGSWIDTPGPVTTPRRVKRPR